MRRSNFADLAEQCNLRPQKLRNLEWKCKIKCTSRSYNHILGSNCLSPEGELKFLHVHSAIVNNGKKWPSYSQYEIVGLYNTSEEFNLSIPTRF